MIVPKPGVILISDPFLKDPNFSRSVVLLCEHNLDGSFGLVLNRPYDQHLNDFIPNLEDLNIPVYHGGPVQPNTLHFVHNIPALISEGILITEDLYWGGKFDEVIECMRNKSLDLNRIKFFLGYSGWGVGQLNEEMEEKSWLTVDATPKLVFQTPANKIWSASILNLDTAFHEIINYPLDPQLN